jgi:pimeloyl-ACP methyl ester carboxylesterase
MDGAALRFAISPGTAERTTAPVRAGAGPARAKGGCHCFAQQKRRAGVFGRPLLWRAAEEPAISERLLLLSYPLHSPQRPEDLRTAHFPKLQVPALFVHGVKDGFGTIDEMKTALKLIPAPTELIPVAGAGHELMSKRNRDGLTATIVTVLTPRPA